MCDRSRPAGVDTRALRVMAWLPLFFLGACLGDDTPAADPVPSADPRRNVLVIDQGFDLSVAELRGKVVAAFTVECQRNDDDGPAPDLGGQGGADAGADGGAPSFADIKQAFISRLMVASESCRLRPGIDDKPDPLAHVRRYRDRFNGMIRRQQYADKVFYQAELEELSVALDSALATFAFHGTATAGIVAHDNPNVRLVLVERRLGDSSRISETFECMVQAEIDQSVALLEDPEVWDAYARAPASRYWRDLQDLAGRYNIGVVNESFGSLSRIALEELQASKGCQAINLRRYFQLLHDATQAWRQTVGGSAVLLSKAAGNESSQLDSPADGLDCVPNDPLQLLVGSYDLAETRSTFSNFGTCVDLYAPGERVIAPYGGGWLFPVQGTSFAAPLVARLLSRASGPYDPTLARDALLAMRDSRENIPIRTFPRAFFYSPGNAVGARSGALTAAPGWLPGVRRGVISPPVELGAVLAPLRALREARRR